ncbi:methyltransferase, FkbM family [Rhizobiales bacterium GAS191]|nr:methyltransferase, FkbM family [Rhizobiales bacterium GAS191]
MRFVSFAQNYEDVILNRAFKEVGKGFYIDVGAADPEEWSVTKAFYDRGWRGINIEPEPAYAKRLRQARPRDVTLELAVGAEPGRMVINQIPGTGLSTFSEEFAARHAAAGYGGSRLEVEVATLADICRAQAPAEIHFLKIDVEGAEAQVLRGADFTRYRPFVILVEATEPMSQALNYHEADQILSAAGYVFVWFDGLNRFYVAREHEAALRPAFGSPPNVFDDFVRAEEERLRGRTVEAEQAASASLQASSLAQERALRAEEAASAALGQRSLAEGRVIRAEAAAAEAERRGNLLEIDLLHAEKARQEVLAAISAMRGSASWRLTAPVRAFGYLRRGKIGAALIDAGASAERMRRLKAAAGPDGGLAGRAARLAAYLASRGLSRLTAAAPAGAAKDLGRAPPDGLERQDDGELGAAADAVSPRIGERRASRRRHAVHQFHAGSAVGDAVTNAMFIMQRLLRRLGYRSEIFVEHRDPRLADRLLEIGDLPYGDDYALIVRHSTGYDAFPAIMSLPAPKILIYHNITPPEFLEDAPALAAYAALGRRQVAQMRSLVSAALADSEYNALELRRMGHEEAAACPLLFDLDALLSRARRTVTRTETPAFTLLFVGRIVASKGQADLVDAFARFLRLWGRPGRLVLVGRILPSNVAYAADIERRAQLHGIKDQVVLTGAVSDDELDAWYRSADAFVSLSLHEGFGVPLVEAMAYDVPVLAYPCGAVPYTLGNAAILLPDRSPDAVAAALVRIAGDPGFRASVIARQRRSLERFELDRHVPRLVQALVSAGAAVPPDVAARQSLAENLHITILGPVGGTSKLAALNRAMALALEARRPGLQRIRSQEDGHDLADLPDAERRVIADLVSRRDSPTEPRVVISRQHSTLPPSLEPDEVALSMLGDEDTQLPAETTAILNRGFRALLVPTASAAKALIDSGISLPVRIVGHGQPEDALRPEARQHEAFADRIVAAALVALAPPPAPLRLAWVSPWDVGCEVAEYSQALLASIAAAEPDILEPAIILCDDRTPPAVQGDGTRVIPAWHLGDANAMASLARKISVCDPDAVVIQHQPDLIGWGELARLIGDRRVRDRISVVTLHAVPPLAASAGPERDIAVEALRQASRILVHGAADLDTLAGLGLADNVTLFPHGATIDADGERGLTEPSGEALSRRLRGMILGLRASGSRQASGADP